MPTYCRGSVQAHSLGLLVRFPNHDHDRLCLGVRFLGQPNRIMALVGLSADRFRITLSVGDVSARSSASEESPGSRLQRDVEFTRGRASTDAVISVRKSSATP